MTARATSVESGMRCSTGHHLTGILDLDRGQMLALFERADSFCQEPSSARRHCERVVGLLFYEPSTRTRLSFASAVCRLGAQAIGFDSPETTSVHKGESLVDTIRAVQRYCDLIVLRHPAEGAARLAAKVALVPMINGGDGAHEHPTQTLYDLYTIWRRLGAIEGKVIGIMGDLRFGRTAHSLALAAASFRATVICIAPEPFQMPKHLVSRIRALTEVELVDDVERVVPSLDVLYLTRVQKERFGDAQIREGIRGYPFGPSHLTFARQNLLIMHPLPRAGEVDYQLDDDPRAWYFEQVANGVPMRMAILDHFFSKAASSFLGARAEAQKYDDPPWILQPHDVPPCSNPRCVTRLEHGIAPRLRLLDEGGDRWQCSYCDHEQ